MTNKIKKEKREQFIANSFLDLYNNHKGKTYSFVRNGIQGRKNEPDIICSGSLNIEIVGIYYSELIKKREEYNLKVQEYSFIKNGEINFQKILIEGPDNLALDFILKQISIKNTKLKKGNYEYEGDIFLLIDILGTPITTIKDYQLFFKNLNLSNSKFNEIWLFDKRTFIGNQNGFESDVNFKGSIYNDNYIIYQIL